MNDMQAKNPVIGTNLVALRSSSSSPISRLPPEMLSRVFLYVRDDHLSIHTSFGKSPYWIRFLTHVCRHWKQVAINCPQIWSRLDFGTYAASWMELQLRLSKQAPLSVTFTSDVAGRSDVVLLKVLHQPHRLISLEVPDHQPYHPASDYLDILVNASAPILRTLVVRNTQNVIIGLGPQPHFILPDNLLSGGTPSLRHLELHDFLIDFNSTLLHNLTVLKLSTLYFPPSFNITHLFDALETSPNLTTLHLFFGFPASPEHPQPRQRDRIPLRNLQDLQLRTGLWQCIVILNNLAVPFSTLVGVDIISPDDFTDAINELTTSIENAWLSKPLECSTAGTSESDASNRTKLPIRSLRFTNRGYARLYAQIYFEHQAFDPPESMSDYPSRYISPVVIGSSSTMLIPIISALFETHHLESLNLQDWKMRIPQHLLWPSSYLHTLVLEGSKSTNTFLRSMEHLPMAEMYLPRLTHITFYQVDFSLNRKPKYQVDHPIDRLLAVLESRKAQQELEPIKCVRFILCFNLFQSHVDNVERLVSEVRWVQPEGIDLEDFSDGETRWDPDAT